MHTTWATAGCWSFSVTGFGKGKMDPKVFEIVGLHNAVDTSLYRFAYGLFGEALRLDIEYLFRGVVLQKINWLRRCGLENAWIIGYVLKSYIQMTSRFFFHCTWYKASELMYFILKMLQKLIHAILLIIKYARSCRQ